MRLDRPFVNAAGELEEGAPVAAEAADGRRFVVANGYGADPAVSTDRVLLERDPYVVVEGLAIAAFAVGATEAIVAVRADQPDVIRRLETAIASAEEAYRVMNA